MRIEAGDGNRLSVRGSDQQQEQQGANARHLGRDRFPVCRPPRGLSGADCKI
jgi:hypothetical protein